MDPHSFPRLFPFFEFDTTIMEFFLGLLAGVINSLELLVRVPGVFFRQLWWYLFGKSGEIRRQKNLLKAAVTYQEWEGAALQLDRYALDYYFLFWAFGNLPETLQTENYFRFSFFRSSNRLTGQILLQLNPHTPTPAKFIPNLTF